MMKKRFDVKGMSCAACKVHVDKAVRGVDGVIDCQVNLLTNTMDVEFDENVNIDDINKAVSNAGYKSKLQTTSEYKENNNNELKNKIIKLIISIIFLVPLFYFSMGHMMNWNIGYFKNHHISLGIMLMILSFILMAINNKFFINGFKGLIHKSLNMDTLVALGSGIAFLYSVIILFVMAHYFDDNDMVMKYSMNLAFETAGMVPTLISIGKMLEEYSKGKTTSALNALMDMTPKMAHVIRNDKEVTIEAKDVILDDIFVVKPGEAVPVDGIIIDGISSVDEAMLTGESMPCIKQIGDIVYAATINADGTIKCKATGVGESTSFSKICKMVEDASNSKAKIAGIADTVAGIFVPIVISISLIVFILWMIFGKSFVSNNTDELHIIYSLERAISVLVISCPCALGLATPVAIMVGNGKAARNRILFKNATALEETSKMNFVVLDKTGTITKGNPEIVNVIPFDIPKDELLKLAASIEALSSHPIAKAIMKCYDGDLYEVLDFNNNVGSGISGIINEKLIIACNLTYAKTITNINDDILHIYYEESKIGRTPLFFIYDNNVVGIISISDVLKDDSKEAIKRFKKLGLIPIMITGDNEIVANYIAKSVGIDYVMSEALPEDKLNIINELKKYGKVLMIGDGINDAPALTSASIGIAIGAGSDVALDSADVVLVGSSLLDATRAIKLSRYTLLNIKENLFWAFIYNIIMIPIAAGLFANTNIKFLKEMRPWYGALAMALSSVIVVFNALRINYVNLDNAKYKKMINVNLNNILKKGDSNMKELKLNVEGMMCGMCKAHVEKACLKVNGVKEANASLEEKNVIIKYDDNVNVEEIKSNIKDAGYEVK